MRENHQTKNHQTSSQAAGDATPHQVVEMIMCPRHRRRVSVTFETIDGLNAMRTGVADCPLMDGACDLSCLIPVGGKAFS